MNTDCILESIGEAIESYRRSINGDFLAVRITQPTHSFSIIGQVKFGTIYAVFVVQPV